MKEQQEEKREVLIWHKMGMKKKNIFCFVSTKKIRVVLKDGRIKMMNAKTSAQPSGTTTQQHKNIYKNI